MLRQSVVQESGWHVDDQPTVEFRGRGTPILSRSGQRAVRGRGRGRGRGLHMERLHEHAQIVDNIIEDDVQFPTTVPRVKVARKTAPILTKGILF